MAPGDFSNVRSRGRGFSTETRSTQKDPSQTDVDLAVCHVRRPEGAPTNELDQKHAGFERFLKTHSSPNHQRVTAGGRIVPMEKRSAPPRFDLQSSRDHTNAGVSKKHVLEPLPALSMDGNLPQQSTTQSSSSVNSATGQNAMMPTTSGIFTAMPCDFGPTPTTLTSPLYPASNVYGLELSGNWGVPLYAPLPHLTNGMSVGLSQYAPVLADWSYSPPWCSMSGSTSPMSPVFHSFNESTTYLQQQLDHARSTFEAIDHQLKEHDRLCAPLPREDERVNRRWAIVDQRAKAYEQVRSLEKALNNDGFLSHMTSANGQSDAQQLQPNTTTSFSHKLNVEAASYIPKRATGSARVEIIAPQAPKQIKAATLTQATPIANPTEREEEAEPQVDNWGVRLGRAPPDLEREQSRLSESLIGDSSSSRSSHGDAGLEEIPNFRSQSPDVSDEVSGASSDCEQPGLENAGRAPAAVERDYEAQLDALRQPKGEVTMVQLSNGSLISVEGQNLQRPASSEMSEFERRYWSRKTVEPTLSNAWSLGAGAGAGQGNLINISSTLKASSLPKFPSEPSPETNFQDHFGDFIQRRTNFETRITNTCSEQPQQEVETFDVNNKAFSSVAVQSIHALCRLPQSLDGATDASLRKMLEPDTASSKKTKSPKLLYRSKVAGSAWYGPFRRNYHGSTSPENH